MKNLAFSGVPWRLQSALMRPRTSSPPKPEMRSQGDRSLPECRWDVHSVRARAALFRRLLSPSTGSSAASTGLQFWIGELPPRIQYS